MSGMHAPIPAFHPYLGSQQCPPVHHCGLQQSASPEHAVLQTHVLVASQCLFCVGHGPLHVPPHPSLSPQFLPAQSGALVPVALRVVLQLLVWVKAVPLQTVAGSGAHDVSVQPLGTHCPVALLHVDPDPHWPQLMPHVVSRPQAWLPQFGVQLVPKSHA